MFKKKGGSKAFQKTARLVKRGIPYQKHHHLTINLPKCNLIIPSYLRPRWSFDKIITWARGLLSLFQPPTSSHPSLAQSGVWRYFLANWTVLVSLNLSKTLHQFSLLQLVQRRVLRVYRDERIPGEMWLIKTVDSYNKTSGWKSSRPRRKHNHDFVPEAERSSTFRWEK